MRRQRRTAAARDPQVRRRGSDLVLNGGGWAPMGMLLRSACRDYNGFFRLTDRDGFRVIRARKKEV